MDDHENSIAIVGMAGRFPGAESVDELWQNLCAGVESIRAFTDEELSAAGVSDEARQAENFVNAGAPLKDASAFDAKFFGYLPREAELMDPQHRLFLETAWHALEDAACVPDRFDGDIGVFGSVARNTYFLENALTYRKLMRQGATYDATLGSDKDYPATRTAYQLNLNGPAMNIQTACSSSGVATHLACQALLNGECDLALSGGARIQVPVSAGYLWLEGGIPSPDGHCRTFDANANGTVYGSGVAVVALKRLEDALADGDDIYSVIRATAVNNDGGDKVGFTAPGRKGQTAVIETALALADINPETISYVEAHGTATNLGDPIEIAALTEAYRKQTSLRNYCAIGSLKSNIGHLDAGAGVAGLIKTSLMLKHARLVPSLHFEKPNPQIDFASSPFFVSTQYKEWPQSEQPRRAAVSAFGLGGTNFHAILEEAPPRRNVAITPGKSLLLLSAKQGSNLDQAAISLGKHLDLHADLNLGDVALTLLTGRKHFDERLAIVAESAKAAGQSLQNRTPTFTTRGAVDKAYDGVAFVFSGQGAQYPGMAAGLYQSEPVYRDSVDYCLAKIEPELRETLSACLCLEDANDDTSLNQTRIAQLALFIVEYSLVQLWRSRGVAPQVLLGHSLGEVVAACIAGVFSLDDALNIVSRRGELMQSAEPGTMLAVAASADDLQPLPDAVELAALNGPNLTVVAGPKNAIDTLKTDLDRRELDCRELQTSHAFHTQSMQSAATSFTEYLKTIDLSAPTLPILSNLSGDWLSDKQAQDPAYWGLQLRSTVKMTDCISALLAKKSLSVIEVGPGHAQSGFVRQHPNYDQRLIVQSLAHPSARGDDQNRFLLALASLWCNGLELTDQDILPKLSSFQPCHLPGYAFSRDQYWLAGDRQSIDDSQTATPTLPSADIGEYNPELTRVEKIQQRLASILESLSGLDASALDPQTSFVELGFDSLFLTRANSEFKRISGVEIGFRQLFDEAPSLEALARYIDENLDDSDTRFDEQSTATTTNTGSDSADSGYATPFAEEHSGPTAEKPIGPWKPLATGDFAQLSQKQQTHLSELIDRIVAKTPGSKNYAKEHRPHLADPRAVAGFRRIWKEMVYPLVVERSSGASVIDIDGNTYTDVAMGFGVSFLGHNPSYVIEAVKAQLDRGVEIGPQNAMAGEVARMVCEFTGLDRAAFCNTGSEAVLAAIRMARTVSGRDRIAVFSGDYHGIFDDVLAKRIDQQNRSRTVAVAPGIPEWSVNQTLVLEHGDERSFEVLRAHAHELAAIVVEPVQSRHPDLQPAEYLRALRALATELDVALVIDEVITGFRCHPGGIQALWDVEADIAAYGKAVGGGFPIAVVAGKRKYMDALDGGHWDYGDDSFPEVGVTWFAGTFVRHPAALAASRAALLHMREQGPELQRSLNKKTTAMVSELNSFLQDCGAPIHIEHFSSLFHLKFLDHADVASILYGHLRNRNIHISEGRMSFLSAAHTAEQIQHFTDALKESVIAMQADDFLPRDFVRPPELVQAGAWPRKLPMLPGQKEIWLAASLDDNANRAFNLTNTLRLKGQLNRDALSKALQELYERHDSLRTRFDRNCTWQIIEKPDRLAIRWLDFAKAPDPEAERQQALDACAMQPFDLFEGPLFRASVATLGAQDHVLILAVHHSICDGWSSGTLLRETGALYAQYSGATESGPGVVTQCSQLLQRLATPEQVRTRQRSKTYWLEQLGSEPPALRLPTDFERPAQRSYAAGRIDLDLSDALMIRVKQGCADQKTTLFSFLLSVYCSFLHRWTGQDDFIVGVSAAQQSAQNLPNLVSHCVHMLPVRFQATHEQEFDALLSNSRSAILDAFDHQALTFSELIPDLQRERHGVDTALISSTFNLDPSLLDMHFADLDVESYAAPRRFEFFDLFFNVVETQSAARIECTYNAELFRAETIQWRLQSFVSLLESVLINSSQTLGELPFVTRDEELALAVFNDTQSPSHDATRLTDYIAAGNPGKDKIAIKYLDTSLSYGDLYQQVDALAHLLMTEGLNSGDIAGIYMMRSPSSLIAMLATLKAGAAYLPLDPNFPASRLAYMLKDSGARMLLTDGKLQTDALNFDGTAVNINTSTALTSSEDTPDIKTGSGDQTAYVLYTSGSTGRPKGVEVTHSNVINFLQAMATRPGLGSDDVLVAVTTTSFDISVLELYLPLATGATLVIASSDQAGDAVALAKLMETSGCTVLQATPATWRVLLASGWKAPNGFRALCGGEALPRDLAAELLNTGVQLWNLYGPTETTVWSSAAQILDPAQPINIGTPIDNTQIHVLDNRLERLGFGMPGEICIAGAGVSNGYLHHPELTDAAFVANPLAPGSLSKLYKTGDLGRWNSAGQLEHLGRIGTQVKIRGFRIELGEIESVLSQHESVDVAFCHVWEAGNADSRLVASIKLNPAKALDIEALRQLLRAHVPDYMIPQYIQEIATIPLTANGKVDRKQLPAPVSEVSQDDYEEPRTDAEQAIASIWSDVIGADRIGRFDNFFEIGGHSLLAVKAAAAMESDLGWRPELRDLVLLDLSEIAETLQNKAPQKKPKRQDKRGLLSRLFKS